MSAGILQLALAAVLLLIHVGAQSFALKASAGDAWSASPRDEAGKESRLAGRLRRSLFNYLETLPAFALVLVAAELSDRTNDWTVTGGWVWLAGRAAYLPLYAAGVPWVRSVVWTVATAGIAAMLVGLALGQP